MGRKRLPKGTVDLYKNGVRSIRLLPEDRLLIGAGDGTVELVEQTQAIVKEPSSIAFKLPSIPALKVVSVSGYSIVMILLTVALVEIYQREGIGDVYPDLGREDCTCGNSGV